MAVDRNGDGKVSSTEKELVELENETQKITTQRKIAIAAFAASLLVMSYLLLGFAPIERIEALSSLIETFYFSMAGIVAAFFGAEAFLTKK